MPAEGHDAKAALFHREIEGVYELLLKLLKKSLQRTRTTTELNELALMHYARGELDAAEQYFRKVVLQTPAEVTAWTNLAATIVQQQKYAAAVPVLLEILELEPNCAEAHFDLGLCYNRLKNNAEAIRHYRKAIALKPTLAMAYANIINAYLDSCEWNEIDRWTREFLKYRKGRAVQDWAPRVEPYCALTLFPGKICKEVAIHRSVNIERSIENKASVLTAEMPSGRKRKTIRLGYVSSNFCATHPMASLTFRLYETHQRNEFEVFAYSMGPDDGSPARKHIERTCDRFIDVRHETPELIARRIRSDEIDILIDMMGYTADSRPQIFAYRPAPVQVGYIGYPGTMGAPYIDYFISDRVATPPGYEAEFTEKLAYLPDCYLVYDHQQPISPQPLSRAEFGLPERSFVYCGFNMPRKIDRKIFSVWMNILRKVPNSVLWLMADDALAEANLRKEASARSVDPNRLIFAERREKPVHLARHRLADLFLDAYICNAHTGACDALWAGLPLLTCPGATFIARVAASVLSAAGLPELITRDLDEYESTAIRLTEDRALLSTYNDKLERNRATCALFDTRRYVRNVETAYQAMLETYRSGSAPQHLSVAP